MQKQNGYVIALGAFDGMHIGHQQLLSKTVCVADENEWIPAVYTFSNHPRSLFGKAPELLSTNQEKEAAMRSLGIKEVCMVPFDETMMQLSPKAFLFHLQKRYPVCGIVAGYNYTFGHYGAGKVEDLQQLGNEMGIKIIIMPEVTQDGKTVSSSAIRAAIKEGSVSDAAKMLGKPYVIGGHIVANRHIGSTIGFPTANLDMDDNKLLPPIGVYATYAKVKDCWYPAVTNIGTNPTVNGDKLTIETHLLDFDQMIYGEELHVAFYERIRGDKTFWGLEELSAQIASDVITAKKLLNVTQRT